ncbi:hypothetical protein ACI0FM_12665 [Paenochrobactrum sp. BZR 588]|uniref:hypothetical protein n=1 Tax=unclassified Paenochrobactrum TaxID=2639760 RepID=UPI0038523E24
MKRKYLTKLAVVSVLLMAPFSQAFAYSIHVNNGVYVIECKNGVTSQGTHLQVTHAQAEYFCRVRGSSIKKKDVAPKAEIQPSKKMITSN